MNYCCDEMEQFDLWYVAVKITRALTTPDFKFKYCPFCGKKLEEK